MEFEFGFDPSPSPAAPYQPDPRGMRPTAPPYPAPAPIALREEGALGQALRGLDHLDGAASAKVQELADRLVSLGAQTGRVISPTEATLAAAQALVNPSTSGDALGIIARPPGTDMAPKAMAQWVIEHLRHQADNLPWTPEETGERQRLRQDPKRRWHHLLGLGMGLGVFALGVCISPERGHLESLRFIGGVAFTSLGVMGSFAAILSFLQPTITSRTARLKAYAQAVFAAQTPDTLALLNRRVEKSWSYRAELAQAMAQKGDSTDADA